MSGSVEIVTLVLVEFPRLGTASGRSAFNMGKREHNETREVPDEQPATIRGAVAAIAQEQGESSDDLAHLVQVNDYRYGAKGQLTFNVDAPGATVTYGNAYAICQVITALKVDGRYFKVDEIRATT